MNRLEKLRERLNKLLDAMTEMSDRVVAEERDFDEDEQKTFDAHKADVEGLRVQIEREEELEKLAKMRAVPVEPQPAPQSVPFGQGARDVSQRMKGQLMVDMLRAAANGGRNPWAGIQWAEANGKKEVAAILKAAVAAADTTTSGWATELVQTGYAEFIDLLRAQSIYARVPNEAAVLGRNGSLLFPGLTAGVAAGFVGESGVIPVKKATFNRQELKPFNLKVITTASMELLMRSNPSADMAIRDSMVRDTGVALDGFFIDDTAAAAGVRPAGLQTYDAAAIDGTPASAPNTIAEMDTHLGTALTNMIGRNMSTGLFWLINPGNVVKLERKSTATGSYPYRDELAAGRLFRFPFFESETVPAGKILLVHGPSLYTLREGEMRIDMSMDATLHMEDTTPTAIGTAGPTVAVPAMNLFQQDEVAWRLVMPVSWGILRTGGVEVIENLSL